MISLQRFVVFFMWFISITLLVLPLTNKMSIFVQISESLSVDMFQRAFGYCIVFGCFCVIYGLRYVLYVIIFPPPLPNKHYPLLFPNRCQNIQVRNILLIVNPKSGKEKSLLIANEKVIPFLEKHQIQIQLIETKYPGHAKEITEHFDYQNIDAIAIMGGDGTFHEVVNGMLSRKDGKIRPLAFLSGGTGNSFLQDFGSDAKNSLQWIIDGSIANIDVIHIQDEHNLNLYSINTIGLGLLGEAGMLAESFRWCGSIRYTLCGLWLLLKRKYETMHLQIWNEEEKQTISGSFLTVFVNLTQHFGYQMRAVPFAFLDDGKMDLVALKSASRAKLFGLFHLLPSGRHYTDPCIFKTQPSRIHIDFDNKEKRRDLCVDGEIISYLGSLSCECIKNKVPIFVPC